MGAEKKLWSAQCDQGSRKSSGAFDQNQGFVGIKGVDF